MQKKLNKLSEDVSIFLDNLFETEGNQEALAKIGQRLDVKKKSLVSQLSDEKLKTCKEMLCAYLGEGEGSTLLPTTTTTVTHRAHQVFFE